MGGGSRKKWRREKKNKGHRGARKRMMCVKFSLVLDLFLSAPSSFLGQNSTEYLFEFLFSFRFWVSMTATWMMKRMTMTTMYLCYFRSRAQGNWIFVGLRGLFFVWPICRVGQPSVQWEERAESRRERASNIARPSAPPRGECWRTFGLQMARGGG